VLGVATAGVTTSFFFSSSIFTGSDCSFETGVVFSATGVSSAFSAITGDSVFSTVGASVAEASFSSVLFASTVSYILLSTDVSAVCDCP